MGIINIIKASYIDEAGKEKHFFLLKLYSARRKSWNIKNRLQNWEK